MGYRNSDEPVKVSRHLLAWFIYSILAAISTTSWAQSDNDVPFYGYDDSEPETAVDESRNRFWSIASFRDDDPDRLRSRPVGRVELILEDKNGERKMGNCTGTLISDDQILTAYHCIPGTNESFTLKDASITFNYLREFDYQNYDNYKLDLESITGNSQLDYAIVKTIGEPGKIYGTANVSARDPKDHEQLYLYHHPQGKPLKLTRFGCQAAYPAVQSAPFAHVVGHRCDTLKGSSGAMVFALPDNAFVGLHVRGGLNGGDFSSFNKALRAELVALGVAKKEQSEDLGYSIPQREQQVFFASGSPESQEIQNSAHQSSLSPNKVADASKPNLKALIVGVSNYLDRDIPDTMFGDIDAKDFTDALLNEQSSDIYREVSINTLVGDLATKNNLERVVHDLSFEGATEDDVLVIYLNGYLYSEDGALSSWFLTYDTDLDRIDIRLNGFSLIELGAKLDTFPGTTHLFLDTVNFSVDPSGEEQTLDFLMNNLANTSIYSASMPGTDGIEIQTLGRGVFMQSVLEAIAGRADLPPFDLQISSVELALYLDRRIRELTDGKQVPVYRARSSSNVPLFSVY